jgi:uncharacterized protein YjbI with pentapeptide repeats
VTDKQWETTDKKMAIEVAHEALIREWELLRQWLDQDRANLLQQRKIETLAQDWEKSGRKSAYLLVGFRLKEARKFQKEQALQYPLKKLGSDFIAKSLGKQQQNFWKLGIIPLIGVGVITFFGIRTYIVQSSWKIVQETQGDKDNVRRNVRSINALEDLAWWQESLKKISLEKANLSQIQLQNANLERANLNRANLTDSNLNFAKLNRANLTNANLTRAELNFAELYSADLKSVNLKSAELSPANLSSANLSSADLSNADLSSADLSSAELLLADLDSADLSSAELLLADLDLANLDSANLTSANLIGVKNLTNAQIKSACFWNKAIYEGNYDQQKREWITDEKANQAFIKQLKQDKASDPEVEPDCSMWEK